MVGNVNYDGFRCPDLKVTTGFLSDFDLEVCAEQAGSGYFGRAQGHTYLIVLNVTEKPGLIAGHRNMYRASIAPQQSTGFWPSMPWRGMGVS